MSTPPLSQSGANPRSPQTSAQRANLARIRDNQRRSRARKRQYVQEIEQRLREYERQSIRATGEVQVAARRVIAENQRLRELLHRQGATDEYINQYLESTLGDHTGPEMSPAAAVAAAGVTPAPAFSGAVGPGPGPGPGPGSGLSPAVQALQQQLVPRRPASLDSNAGFQLPRPPNRESIASVPTTAPSLWQTPQQGMAPMSYAAQHPVHLPGGPGAMPGAPYSTPAYSGESTPRQQQQQQQRGHYASHQLAGEIQGHPVDYNDPNASFNPNPHDYGPAGDY